MGTSKSETVRWQNMTAAARAAERNDAREPAQPGVWHTTLVTDQVFWSAQNILTGLDLEYHLLVSGFSNDYKAWWGVRPTTSFKGLTFQEAEALVERMLPSQQEMNEILEQDLRDELAFQDNIDRVLQDKLDEAWSDIDEDAELDEAWSDIDEDDELLCDHLEGDRYDYSYNPDYEMFLQEEQEKDEDALWALQDRLEGRRVRRFYNFESKRAQKSQPLSIQGPWKWTV
jgi:hypothetical protein